MIQMQAIASLRWMLQRAELLDFTLLEPRQTRSELLIWSCETRSGRPSVLCSHIFNPMEQCIVSLSASNLVSRSFSSPCSSGNSCGSNASVANIPMWWGLQIQWGPQENTKVEVNKNVSIMHELNALDLGQYDGLFQHRVSFTRTDMFQVSIDNHSASSNWQLVYLLLASCFLYLVLWFCCSPIYLMISSFVLPRPASEACLNSGSAGY